MSELTDEMQKILDADKEAAKAWRTEERLEARSAIFDEFVPEMNKLFSKFGGMLINYAGQTKTQATNEVIGILIQCGAGEACRLARSEGREPDIDLWRKFTEEAFNKAANYTRKNPAP